MNANPKPADSWRLVHWNIKELDSGKFAQAHPQIQAAADVLKEWDADLFSINEVHCDAGRDNLGAFLQLCSPELSHYRLSPSNTGLRSDPKHRKVDRSNFGWFPGQYATGFASRFPLEKTLEIQNLRWKEWEPNVDLRNFNLGGVSPDEIELFDKSFTVHWLKVGGRSLCIICLHTVPAFNFGQDKSPNPSRNRAQLEFLQWYLTGDPLPAMSALGIEPLPKDQAFIAVGDFNTPLHDKRYPGGQAIAALLQHPRLHPEMARIPQQHLEDLPRYDPHVTFIADGWDYNALASQLDYFLVSKDIRIHRMEVVFANPGRQIHGLFDPDTDLTPLLLSLSKPGRVASVQRGSAFGKFQQVAVVSVSEAYARLRAGSDHLPLVLDFSWV